MGPVADVMAALAAYQAELQKLGVSLQPSKSKCYTPADKDTITAACAEAGVEVADGIMAAGTPIGTPAFVHAALTGKVDEIAHKVERLKRLWSESTAESRPDDCSAQALALLLRRCIAPASFNYWLRTVPPAQVAQHADRFDRVIYDLVRHLLGSGDDPALEPTTVSGALAKRRMHLAGKLGGLGLTSAVTTSKAAYVGSLALVGCLIARTLEPVGITPADAKVLLPELRAIVESGYLVGNRP